MASMLSLHAGESSPCHFDCGQVAHAEDWTSGEDGSGTTPSAERHDGALSPLPNASGHHDRVVPFASHTKSSSVTFSPVSESTKPPLTLRLSASSGIERAVAGLRSPSLTSAHSSSAAMSAGV